MSRKITKQYNEPDERVICLEKWYKVNIHDDVEIEWDNNTGEILENQYDLINERKPFIEINWTAFEDIVEALENESKEDWTVDNLLKDTDYLNNFRTVSINGRHNNPDKCKIYRAQKKVLTGFFKWKTETYYYIKDFYFSNQGNWFYFEDKENGDIIDFKVKIISSRYSYTDHPPCVLLYNQIKVKDDNGNDIVTTQTSNYIYVKDNYFDWSVESFADNLGGRLTNNDKIGKPYALEIYYPTAGTADDGDVGSTEIEVWDGYTNDSGFGNAVVTYTLLTFDD